MNREKLQESIRIHEGLSLTPYKCPAGKLTIGFGKNLDAGITIKQAYLLLDSDIDNFIEGLDRAFPAWKSHSDARQNVLLEMCFTLGITGILKFKGMRKALSEGDYDKAAEEMLDSHWAFQVGERAETLARIMRKGEF